MKGHFTTLKSERGYVPVNSSPIRSDQFIGPPPYINLPRLRFHGVPYHLKQRHRKAIYAVGKRGLDISVSIAILVAVLPLMAAIIVLIKATSKGPVLFRQKRLGRNGVEFDCLKFRTMVVDADDQLKSNPQLHELFQRKFKLDDDPRITPLGRFLRRTSMDELPQLIQVLQGKMTLIGPRPIVQSEVEKYAIYADKLFSVTPGLSGLWQTCGRSDTTYPERVQLDMYYIDNRSLRFELQLMLLTVVTVLKRSGAC